MEAPTIGTIATVRAEGAEGICGIEFANTLEAEIAAQQIQSGKIVPATKVADGAYRLDDTGAIVWRREALALIPAEMVLFLGSGFDETP